MISNLCQKRYILREMNKFANSV